MSIFRTSPKGSGLCVATRKGVAPLTDCTEHGGTKLFRCIRRLG